MSLRNSSPKSSAGNLLEAFEGMNSELVRKMSGSAMMFKRRISSHPSVVIEDYGPERYFHAEFEQLMDEMDTADIHDYEKADARDQLSRDPSYTKEFFGKLSSLFRYTQAQRTYQEQFKREIELLTEYQPTALESAYFVRHMAYTSLWPPLHNRRELKRASRLFHPYNKKQERRLQLLLRSRN